MQIEKSRRPACVPRWSENPDLSAQDEALILRFLETGDSAWLDGTPYEESVRVYGTDLFHLDNLSEKHA